MRQQDPLEEQVADMVHAATLAPSMHNTQPWRFRLLRDAETIELYADPDRMLPHSDPHGRAVHIACGAALFNLRVAAATAGRQTMVRLLPATAEPLLLALDQANVDEAVFARPDEFDIRRADNPHLTFGHGPRYCIGAPLARIELQTVLAQLLRRVPTLRLAVGIDELRPNTHLLTGGLAELPVTW